MTTYDPKRDFRSISEHDLRLIREEEYEDGYSRGFGAGWWWGVAVEDAGGIVFSDV